MPHELQHLPHCTAPANGLGINMTNDEDNSNTYERNILTVCDVHQHDKR